MRFHVNGPSIPDELLLARDQGRVVFFCGAGVSRAKVDLPDFFGLAKTVTESLGVPDDDPANKIIAESREIARKVGIDGLISADRVFGLLERDFQVRDIQRAVAAALVPKSKSKASTLDLSAHQTLLKLATTPEGIVQLVTTNMDRLFDLCRPELPSFVPPSLPNPARAAEFHGIVYLHGKINEEHEGAEGDGFILSSSEFGRAYLSDGWATSFFKEILERYCVVFVGYSADDPPVQYLLEALNKTGGQIGGVYAFQAGDENSANAKWQHKGVAAIPYDDANGHVALWDTLDAWAVRADDPDGWTRSVVELARSGPASLQPYERGQIAHVVSTGEGVRKFTEGGNPPPATWLCVFDPSQRYASPRYQNGASEQVRYIDFFDLYALDSDSIPEKMDPKEQFKKRAVPDDAWDAFAPNSLDRKDFGDRNVGLLKDRRSNHPPIRLSRLGTWISKVSAQPEAVWWAAHQSFLHADVQAQITRQLTQPKSEASSAVCQAWRYLFDYWSEDREEFEDEWHRLKKEIETNGWDGIVLRNFSRYSRPYLKVTEVYRNGLTPDKGAELSLRSLVSLDVEYPALPTTFAIPEEWLARAIVAVRRNLEIALELEIEKGGSRLRNISPITPEGLGDDVSYARSNELSGWVLYFVDQIKRLKSRNLASAKAELQYWPTSDSSIFARLRIWASGESDLVPADQFGVVIAHLPSEAFWADDHARDLLLAISARWNDLEARDRRDIEQRILSGPDRWEGEEGDYYRARKARASLNRLIWFNEQGCSLQLNLDQITEELLKEAPEWKPEYAKNAATSFGSLGGWVHTETEHSALLGEPLTTTLKRAVELSGRQGRTLALHDPFAGLAQERPARAFAVLRLEGKKGEFPEWAWRTFLNSDARKNDRASFIRFIGAQLSHYSAANLACIVRPATDWIQTTAKMLSTEYPDTFSRLVEKLIDALALNTSESSTVIVRGSKEADWATEAINSPAGKLAAALFDDPRKEGLSEKTGFPEIWLQYVERQLALSGDLRRHALVIFAHQLSWFFNIDPKWTKAELLGVLSSKSEQDKEALWAGFFWGGDAQGREFCEALKPHMISLATSGNLGHHGHTEALSTFLLSAWSLTEGGTGKKWVSDKELHHVLVRSNDDFRSRVLWQAGRWLKDDSEKWSPLLLDFIRDVWPQQKAAKSGLMSAKLCDLAFSDEKNFSKLAAVILPLLTKIDTGYLMLPNLSQSGDKIVDSHPRETLVLLHAVLPDNAIAWPYDIDATIDRIGEADKTLNTDEKLIELKRIWASR